MTRERSCGNCTACCYLPEIAEPELKKEKFTACKHCKDNKGCKIYENRPVACRDFSCMWKMNFTHESKRPDKSGIMIDLLPLNSLSGKSGSIFAIYEYKPGAFKASFFKEVLEFCKNYNLSYYPIILFRKGKKPIVYIYDTKNNTVLLTDTFSLDGKENIQIKKIEEIFSDL
jgi:Fe-S-cluster containining protein